MKKLKKQNPGLLISGIFHNVTPHESFPMGHYLTRRLTGLTDLPILLSSQTQNEFEALNTERQPVKLFHPVYFRPAPNASKTALRHKYGMSNDKTVFLFFGLIRHYKGLDILFDALRLLDATTLDIQLYIAGEFYSDPKPILDRLPASWKDKVTVDDRFIPDDEADELLHASDAMVLPYRSASQSGILADAINFNLPVICTDHPGFTDVVSHNTHGLIVPSENPEKLASAIAEMTQPGILKQMQAHIKQLQTELNWEKFSLAYHNALINTLKRKSEY